MVICMYAIEINEDIYNTPLAGSIEAPLPTSWGTGSAGFVINVFDVVLTCMDFYCRDIPDGR